MSVMNRKMFANRDARTKLAGMGGILASSPEMMDATQRFQEGGLPTPRGVPDSPRLSESLQASAPIAMIGGKSFFLSEDGRFVVDAEGSVVRDPSVLSVITQIITQPQAEEAFVPPSMGPTELNTPGVMAALDNAPRIQAEPSTTMQDIMDARSVAENQGGPMGEASAMLAEMTAGKPEGIMATISALATATDDEKTAILFPDGNRGVPVVQPSEMGPEFNEFGPEGLTARTSAAERDNQERMGLLAARDAEAERMMGINDPVGSSMEDMARMRIAEEDMAMAQPVPQPLGGITVADGPSLLDRFKSFSDRVDESARNSDLGSALLGATDSVVSALGGSEFDPEAFVPPSMGPTELNIPGVMAALDNEPLGTPEVPQAVVEADASGGESTPSGNNFSSDPLYETPAGPEDPIKRDSKGVPTSVNPKRISDEKLQRFTDTYARSDRGPRAQEIYENQLAEYEAAVIQNDARQVYEDDIKAKKDAAAAVDTAAVVTSFNDEIEAAQAAGNTVLVEALQKQQAAAGADLTEIDGDADGSLGTDFTPSAKSTAVVEAPDQTEFEPIIADINKNPGDAGAIVSGAMLGGSGVDTSNMGIKERTVAMKKMLTDLMGQTDADEKEEFWMNMAMVGFGIASGDSPDAMKNIADGLLAGTAQISKGKSDKKARDDKFTLTAYGEVLADERARDKFGRDLALAGVRATKSEYGSRKDPLTQMYMLAKEMYSGGNADFDTYQDALAAARAQVAADYKIDMGGDGDNPLTTKATHQQLNDAAKTSGLTEYTGPDGNNYKVQ